jgi:hypothetical protein
VPRPLGTQVHATRHNEIPHYDFLYIGLSRDGKYQYLLLLKDDLSGYDFLYIGLSREGKYQYLLLLKDDLSR